MAEQVKLSKNGSVVYPQTITDAVAYTPTDTSKSKQKLTTYLESLQSSVNDLQFNSLSPAMSHSGNSVVAVGGSAEITFNITTNGSVATVDATNGPITAVKQHNTIDTTDVSTATKKSTISSSSNGVNTAAVGAKTITATGTLTHISGATKTVSASHTVNVVKPWYCGFIEDYSTLTTPSTQLLNDTTANSPKVTLKPAGQTISDIKASKNSYFVVAIPDSGGYSSSAVNKIISKGAMDAEQAVSTTAKTLTGWTIYVCTDKANAGTYTYAIQ